MQYHISTGLVIKHFEQKCECPLCEMEKIVEANICRELLADGCMDDDVRKQVNAKGFCLKHFEQLYEMESKLGLSLQMTTRTNTLLKTFSKPKSLKEAKKQSQNIKNELSTCLVCDCTNDEMVKYYKTIAQLYYNENEFKQMLKDCNGFCLKHYSKLLEYAIYASFSHKDYLSTLYEVEDKRLKKSVELLNAFSNRHDYRNAGKPLGEAVNALPRIKIDFFGKK